MVITGIGSTYSNLYESRYTSSKKEVTEKTKTEGTSGQQYKNAQDYYEKRKQLREQFEKKQAEKKQIRKQLEERREEKILV